MLLARGGPRQASPPRRSRPNRRAGPCGARLILTADLPTCRPADLPTCRPADLPTCRPADLPTCRPADLPTCALNSCRSSDVFTAFNSNVEGFASSRASRKRYDFSSPSNSLNNSYGVIARHNLAQPSFPLETARNRKHYYLRT
jgi:hypothetical protein